VILPRTYLLNPAFFNIPAVAGRSIKYLPEERVQVLVDQCLHRHSSADDFAKNAGVDTHG
jgi:hypothetical protein